MAGFFQTLLRPDRDDDPLRAEFVRAANLLQIGEFQLLQLAYKAWFDRELGEAESHAVFRAYMLRGEVPPWARHYARRILAMDDLHALDDRDPAYHRYDSDYYKALPLGARRLTWAVLGIAFVMVGGFAVSSFAPASTSILPPYFSQQELSPDKNDDLQGP